MPGAVVDLHYSVERFFQTTLGTELAIAYEGQAFRQDGHTAWAHLSVMGPHGRPSRAVAYSGTVRLSLRIFNRTSQRLVRMTAQDLEGPLRGGTIPVYDESNRTVVLGYLRLQDPSFQSLPQKGGLHSGVLDVSGVLDMDLS